MVIAISRLAEMEWPYRRQRNGRVVKRAVVAVRRLAELSYLKHSVKRLLKGSEYLKDGIVSAERSCGSGEINRHFFIVFGNGKRIYVNSADASVPKVSSKVISRGSKSVKFH